MNKFCLLIVLLLTIPAVIFSQSGPLPFVRTALFAGSGNCAICHTGDGNVLSQNGVDISPPTYWRSTMMANASKDPFWRAIVAEEVHNFSQLQQTIESTCTKCHAPSGYTQALFNGQSNYSIAEMKIDPLANDGVTCTVCHQIKPDNFGNALSYSGNYMVNHDSLIYGPYENPETQSMINSFQFTPVYTTHMNNSELCATCHTLFTPFLNNQGQIAGVFPEQTPYIEWKNSIYPALNTQCQDCHMPKTYEPIDIATIPPPHQVLRTPYWKHNFVGGNVYMLRMLRNNTALLGLTASAENFDSTIRRAEENLTRSAINLVLSTTYQNDSLNVLVKIQNNTGHKIPSGIPLRRMWIHLRVSDLAGNTVFESGNWNPFGEINGLNNGYEPHYNLIKDENDVQIYEGVMVDVDQAVTYRLLRAAAYIKDNRIPPKGFTASHSSYDTTAIFGNALSDPDFNKENMTEGTGADIVNYRIPAEIGSTYKVFAEVCFQTIKPRIIDQLVSINEPDINQFVGLYNNLPNIPYIMRSDSLTVSITGISQTAGTIKGFEISQNYPNPFNPSTIISYSIPYRSAVNIKIFNILGDEIATLVDEIKSAGSYDINFDGSELSNGVYFYTIKADNFSLTKKMVLIK